MLNGFHDFKGSCFYLILVYIFTAGIYLVSLVRRGLLGRKIPPISQTG